MINNWIDLPGSGGGGVTSLNGLAGALTLVAGTNITITPSGSNITIASTAVSSQWTTTGSDLYFANQVMIGSTNAPTETLNVYGTTPGSGIGNIAFRQSGSASGGKGYLGWNTEDPFNNVTGKIQGFKNPGGGLDIAMFTTNSPPAAPTERFRIANTGEFTIGTASTTPQHKLNTSTNTAGASTGTLTNVPGAGGNPTGYVQITINGTASYIPYWQ